jgi:hypothetical protein
VPGGPDDQTEPIVPARGFVQVALYVPGFYAARLYSNTIEQRIAAVAERLRGRPRQEDGRVANYIPVCVDTDP